MFRSFASVNYRLWFVGALVSNVGTWMQATALNWVVLTEVTDYDATAVGITSALQFAPPLLLVPITGWVVDHFEKRYVLYITQTVFLALAIAIGVLLLTETAQIEHLYALAFTFGIVTAFDNPARQTMVTDIVSVQNASNAVALNSASFNTARLIGPAVAGFTIIAVGSGWVFIINAATFLLMLAAIMALRKGQLTPRPTRTSRGTFLEGFSYVAGRKDLLVVFIIAMLIGAFGMNFPIIASTMAVAFGRDADGFGLLSSILAIGSLTGALLSARRDRARVSLVIIAAGLFSVTTAVSAFMPTYWTYAASLIFTGFTLVTLLTTANGYVQTTTHPEIRGRVIALYMATMMGGTTLGAPIVGWVADEYGPRWSIGVAAVAASIGCLAGLIWLVRSGRLHRGAGRWRITLEPTQVIPIVISDDEPDDAQDDVEPHVDEPHDDVPDEDEPDEDEPRDESRN